MKYAIVIHKANGNYSAHAPDVDGCVSTGKTVAQTAANMREALQFHFDSMIEDGESIPLPEAAVEYIEVDVPLKPKQATARPRPRKKVPAQR